MWIVPRVRRLTSLLRRPAIFGFQTRLAVTLRQCSRFCSSYTGADESRNVKDDSFLSIALKPTRKPLSPREKLYQEATVRSCSLHELVTIVSDCPYDLLEKVVEKVVAVGLLEYSPYIVGFLLQNLGRRLLAMGQELIPEFCLSLQDAVVKFIAHVSEDISRPDALTLAHGSLMIGVRFNDMDALLSRLEGLCTGCLSSMPDAELKTFVDIVVIVALQKGNSFQMWSTLLQELMLTVNERLGTISPDILLDICYHLAVIKPTAIDDQLLKVLDERLPAAIHALVIPEMKKIADLFFKGKYKPRHLQLFPSLCNLLPSLNPANSSSFCRTLRFCWKVEKAAVDKSFIEKLTAHVNAQLQWWSVRSLVDLTETLVSIKDISDGLLRECVNHAVDRNDLFIGNNTKEALKMVAYVLSAYIKGDVCDRLFSSLKTSIDRFHTTDTVHFVRALGAADMSYSHFIHLALRGRCVVTELNDNMAINFAVGLLKARISHKPFIMALVRYVEQNFARIASEVPTLVFTTANVLTRTDHRCDEFMQLVVDDLDRTSRECKEVSVRSVGLSWFCAVYGIYPHQMLRAVFETPLDKLKELCNEELCAVHILQLHWLVQGDTVVSHLYGLSSDALSLVENCASKKLTLFSDKHDWLVDSFDRECFGVVTKELVHITLALLYQMPTIDRYGQWLQWSDTSLDPANIYPSILQEQGLVPVAVRIIPSVLFAADDATKPLAVVRMQQKLLRQSGWRLLTITSSKLHSQPRKLDFLKDLLKQVKQKLKVKGKRQAANRDRKDRNVERYRSRRLPSN